MIRVKAPFRISFFGGGTDFEDYYKDYCGAVLSVAIDKYCYVTLRDLPPFFEYKNQFTYSKIERFNEPDEVEHPLVRNALKMLPYDHLQIAYDADLPACSGLGTSSAFAIALLQGLHAMRGEYPDKSRLAAEGVKLERELCAEAGGVQDQYAAAFGGFNRYTFSKNGVKAEPIQVSVQLKKQLEENLLLLFTEFTRYSNRISSQTNQNIPNNLNTLHRMKEMVDEAERFLKAGNLDDFGRLLGENWKLKQTLSPDISNGKIGEIYQKALEHGALGGKILGAGGGGFLLLYVPKIQQARVKQALSEYQFTPFRFETDGSRIVF